MIKASEVKVLKISQLDNMINRTEAEIKSAQYLNRTHVDISFANVNYDNTCQWREKMIDAGYKVRNKEVTIIGIDQFEVIW